MNATVKRIVEILFQDTEMTEEVQALRDELLDNCQQRYEDLMAQGRDEDEAIALVVESLKGMEEVISAYPRAQAGEPCAEHGEDDGRVLYFPAAQVKWVEADLLYQDVHFVPGQGEQVVVRLTGKEGNRLNAWLAGDTLRISRQEDNGGRGTRWWSRVLFFSWGEQVQVELPASCHPGISVHCTSGDLTVQDVSPREVRMDAMSGDITLQTDLTVPLREVNLKSTSGDIRVGCSAERVELQSMSGDVSYQGECPDLTAQSISGDVRLEEEKGGLRQVDAKTTSGDVDIRLPKGTPGVHLTGKSSIGDVRNHFPDLGMESSVLINAQTASGDVKIR